MKFDRHTYFEKGRSLRLKDGYLLDYSLFPGFSRKLIQTRLFVNDSLEYDLFLSFFEWNMEDMRLDRMPVRIELSQHGLLPHNARVLLAKLSSTDFQLKKSYVKDPKRYKENDAESRSCGIRCNGKYFSIDLSSDTVDMGQFTTEPEQDFLKLVDLLEDWLEKLTDTIWEIYTVE